MRIAFFSCQEFIAGFYAAHRDLAAQDVDLVVCLGDYIYEQAFASTGSPNAPVREDDSAADGEAQTLAEYRRKYSLYHTDANLLEVRRQFALVGEWDDHEVEDNYAGGLPGGAAESRRVPFAERRSNGYRAWFEHMPRRLAGGASAKIYGSLPLGNAELFLLDTRQYRDDQPCNPTDAALSAPCPPTTTDDPSRTLLGAEQKAWLKGALSASRARWKVIANQVMICSLDAPPHNPLNTDSWDGYGAERQELVDHIAAEAIDDVTFVTGDIHTFFAGDVTRTGRQSVRGEDDTDPVNGPSRATEFVGGRHHLAGHRRSRRVRRGPARGGRRARRRRGAGQQPAARLLQPGLQGLLHPRGGRRAGSTSATRRSTSIAPRTPASSPCGASASTPAGRSSSTRAVPRRSELSPGRRPPIGRPSARAPRRARRSAPRRDRS